MAGFAGVMVLLGLLVPRIDKTCKETIDGITWRYKVSDGCAIIGRNSRQSYSAVSVLTSGNLAIPMALGGYPVTAVDSFAFEKCVRLKSVTIPDGVKSIGYEAMGGCGNLTEVTIPPSVTKVGDNAFSGCHLERVYVGKGDSVRVRELLRRKGVDVDRVEFVEREDAQSSLVPSTPVGEQIK